MHKVIHLTTLAVLSGCSAQACERVIEHGEGGIILNVAAEVAAEKCSVRLRGQINSADTLWLGARDVCVEPSVRMEFHGPRNYGLFRLSPVDFQYYSQVVADHYPKPLADWYMAAGRYGFWTIRASELVRLGVKAC